MLIRLLFYSYFSILLISKVDSQNDFNFHDSDYEEGSGDLDPLEGSGGHRWSSTPGAGRKPPDIFEDDEDPLDYYFEGSGAPILEEKEDVFERTNVVETKEYEVEEPEIELIDIEIKEQEDVLIVDPEYRVPSESERERESPSDAGMDNKSVTILTQKGSARQPSVFAQPSILAAFIGGAVVGLLCAILLVMFIVYRMRKKDEGSYPLDEPKRMPLTASYSPNDKEIYA